MWSWVAGSLCKSHKLLELHRSQLGRENSRDLGVKFELSDVNDVPFLLPDNLFKEPLKSQYLIGPKLPSSIGERL